MKIIYSMSDNSVRVASLPKAEIFTKYMLHANGASFTEQEFLDLNLKKGIPEDALNINVVDDDFQFPDIDFRCAWLQIDKLLTIDLEKAKEIQLMRVRAKRDLLIAKYDGLQLRAIDLEDKELILKIKNIKQQLRDAPENLKALIPSSIEEIKATTPSLEEF